MNVVRLEDQMQAASTRFRDHAIQYDKGTYSNGMHGSCSPKPNLDTSPITRKAH